MFCLNRFSEKAALRSPAIRRGYNLFLEQFYFFNCSGFIGCFYFGAGALFNEMSEFRVVKLLIKVEAGAIPNFLL